MENACTPLPRQDKPWMRTSFSDVFSKFPHTVEALWESVLALWRLKVSELDGEESEEDVL